MKSVTNKIIPRNLLADPPIKSICVVRELKIPVNNQMDEIKYSIFNEAITKVLYK